MKATVMHPAPLNRRMLLRGCGVSLGLPLLDAMTPSLAKPQEAPRRLITMYVPNGVNLGAWIPPVRDNSQDQQESPELRLGETLKPLAPFTKDFSYLSGLTLDKARANGDGPGDHARACAAFLTGIQPLKADGAVRLGISADQVAAQHLRNETPFSSIVIGGESPRSSGQCDSGYACAYSSHLSWRSPTEPIARETNAGRLFDRLFRGGSNVTTIAERREHARRRRSLLDYVRQDAGALKSKLGAHDKHALDRYLSAIRELELQLASLENEDLEAVADNQRPNGQAANHFARMRVFNNLLVLALTTDRTRVVTFLTANEGSNQAYAELGLQEGHHGLSHHDKDPSKMASIAKIDSANIKVLVHLLKNLASHSELGGSLLDHSAVLYGSGISSGNSHKHHNLPILLCGRLGGALHPGRHIPNPKNTPLSNLHLYLLRSVGVELDQFGDSTGVLDQV